MYKLSFLTFSALFTAFVQELTAQQAKDYILVADRMTYADAQAYCQSQYGTDLASIHSDADNNAARQLCYASGGSCWIGLNDIENEMSFKWEDGTLFNFGSDVSGGKYPWSSLYNPEPNNEGGKGEDCVELWRGVNCSWNDLGCSDTKHVLCNPQISDTQGPTANPSRPLTTSDPTTTNPTTANPTTANPTTANPTTATPIMATIEPTSPPTATPTTPTGNPSQPSTTNPLQSPTSDMYTQAPPNNPSLNPTSSPTNVPSLDPTQNPITTTMDSLSTTTSIVASGDKDDGDNDNEGEAGDDTDTDEDEDGDAQAVESSTFVQDIWQFIAIGGSALFVACVCLCGGYIYCVRRRKKAAGCTPRPEKSPELELVVSDTENETNGVVGMVRPPTFKPTPRPPPRAVVPPPVPATDHFQRRLPGAIHRPKTDNLSVCTVDSLEQMYDSNLKIDGYGTPVQDVGDDDDIYLDVSQYRTWTSEQVVRWMVSLNYLAHQKYESQLLAAFSAAVVNGIALSGVTDEYLADCGVDVVVHRKIILQNIEKLVRGDGDDGAEQQVEGQGKAAAFQGTVQTMGTNH